MSIDIENNNSFNAFYFLNDYISNSITDFIKSTPHNVVSVFNGNLSPEMIITFLSYFGQMSNHLYIISLMQHMGCPIRLRHNVAIDGFCLVISANFLSSLSPSQNPSLIYKPIVGRVYWWK